MDRTQKPDIVVLLDLGQTHSRTNLEAICAEVRIVAGENPLYYWDPLSNADFGCGWHSIRGLTVKAVFDELLAHHPGSVILRIHPHNRVIPHFMLENYLKFHFDGEYSYSYFDLEAISFYNTFMEMFGSTILRYVHGFKYPTLPPLGIVNAFGHPRAAVRQLSPQEAVYFLKTGFQEYFAYPIGINVEISSVCNSRCIMCHFSENHGMGLVDNPPPFMPMDLYQKIVNEVADWPHPVGLDFSWRGEPLMNPEWDRYILYARTRSLPVVLTTNGSLLTNETARKLLDLDISQIIISLDGATAKTYESIRNGLSFARVVRNLENLIDLKKRVYPSASTKIMIKTCIQPENENEEHAIVERWLPLVDHVVQQYKGIYDPRTRHAYSYKVFVNKNEILPFCPQPFLIQSVTATGRVYDCCVAYSPDDVVMGDCRKRSLAQIWCDEPFESKRREMLSGNADRLQNCKACEVPSTAATLKRETIGNTLLIHKHFNRIYSRIKE